MAYPYPFGLTPVTAGWIKNHPDDNTIMGINNDLHGGIKVVPTVEDMLGIHPNYLVKDYTACFVVNTESGMPELYFLVNEPSLTDGSLMEDWAIWAGGGAGEGTVVLPDGIVVHGTAVREGSSIVLDRVWRWRIDGTVVAPLDVIGIEIPIAASGYTRIDTIVGRHDGSIIRVAGDETELPEAAMPANIPPGSVGLITVHVTDTGIADFIQFALAAFVRFDVDNQNLSPVQKANALKNIMAPSSEVESRIHSPVWRWYDWDGTNRATWFRGSGTGNDSRLEFYDRAGARMFRIYTGTPQTGIGNLAPTFFLKGAGTATRTLITVTDGNHAMLFSMLANGVHQWKLPARHPDATRDDESATLGQVKEMFTSGADTLLVQGSVTQSGNTLQLGHTAAWQWRIGSSEYSSTPTDIDVPVPSDSYTRIDIIAGDASGNMSLLLGTQSTDATVPPPLPPGMVGLMEVLSNDTGLVSFQNWALGSFVRYDTSQQNLTETQRNNVRNNIQAVRRDGQDTRTGSLTQNGGLLLLNTGEDGSASSDIFRTRNTRGGGVSIQRRGGLTAHARGDSMTNYFIFRGIDSGNVEVFRVRQGGVTKGGDAINDDDFATLGQVKSFNIRPDGLLNQGSSSYRSSDNTLIMNNQWVWQIEGNVHRKSHNSFPVPIPKPAEGMFRIDWLVGNNEDDYELILGEEYEEVAVEPSIPEGKVGLMQVYSNSLGVEDRIVQGTTGFVRFDTDKQNLSPAQRQNARTNIQAISRDTNDQKTGVLTFKTSEGYDGLRLDGNNWNRVQLRNNSNMVTHIMRTTAQTGIGITSGYFNIMARQPESNRTMISVLDHNGNNIFGLLNGGLAEFGKQAPTHPPAERDNQSLTFGQFKKTTTEVPGTSFNLANVHVTEKLLFTSDAPVSVRVRSVLDPESRFEIRQMGKGTLNFVGTGIEETQVNILVREGFLPQTAGQYSAVWLDWVAENTFLLYGDLAPVP